MKPCNALLVAAVAALAPPSDAATFWTGPPVEFAKASFANPALPENQDRVTPTVWLTRGDFQGLYNAASETHYVSTSPANTLWASGSIADGVGNLTFMTWVNAFGHNPTAAENDPFVLHIIDQDVYIDITFLDWQSGRELFGGGAFRYRRSTPAVTAVPEVRTLPALPPAVAALGIALFVAIHARVRRS